jgi:ribose transport system substrate-binding protein
MTFLDGKNDAAEQSANLDTFIAQKVDAIILMPAVSDPLLPAIKRVNLAKIPLIIVDRKMWTQGTGAKWDAMVNWDMTLSGTIMGAQIVSFMKGRGNMVAIEGTPGAGSTIDKNEAVYKFVNDFPDIKVVYKTNADFRRDKGLLVTQDILAKYPKGSIDLMWFMNDEMVLGGLEAIKAAGRLHEFKIVAGDGDHDAMAALRRGDIDGEFIFHPDDMAVAVPVLEKILHGQKLDRKEVFTVFGRKIVYAPDHEGFPWIRPTCFWVDKDNAKVAGNEGW